MFESANMNEWCICIWYEWVQMNLKSKVKWKVKRGGEILGYDSFPYLIILNLNARIAIAFRVFKVEED